LEAKFDDAITEIDENTSYSEEDDEVTDHEIIEKFFESFDIGSP
jgi:hypothetical protein